MWRNPIPWNRTETAEHRHVGPDRRHAHRHGPRGAHAPARVHRAGRRVHRVEQHRRVRHQQQLHARRERRHRREPRRASSARCCGRRSWTTRARSSTACPTTWRCTATAGRSSRSAPAPAAAGGAGAARRLRRRLAARRGATGGGGRPTGRGTPDDPDTVQGRPMYEGTNLKPVPPPSADAAVAVLAADRGAAEAEPGAT